MTLDVVARIAQTARYDAVMRHAASEAMMGIARRVVLGAGIGSLALGMVPLKASAGNHSAAALAEDLLANLEAAVRPDVGPVEIQVADFTRTESGSGAVLTAWVVVFWRPGLRSMRFTSQGADVTAAQADLIAIASTRLACFQGPLAT